MNPNAESNAARNERAFRSISYVLMFLMFTCAAMAIGGVVYNFAPGWHSSVIAGVILLIVIDRLYTYPRFKSLQFLSTEWTMTLGAHWIVFILFIRLLLSYVNGSKAFVRDLALFGRGDWVSFFSPDFVLTLILGVLAWFIPGQVLQVLDEIGLDPRLALRDESAAVQREAVPAHQRLVNWVFSIGIVLVLLAAMARLNLHATFSNPNGFAIVLLDRFSAAEAGVLFYFIFGLALLSLSRLMSLQTRWNRQRIPISSDSLVRRWGLYSLVFLLLLALVISLLPAGKGLGFLSLVGILLSFLISVFAFIAGLIVALILLLISLPFLLLGKPPPIASSSAPPLVLPTMPAGALPPTSSAIWEVMRSILLWGSIILIIAFSLVRFLRQHEGLSSSIRKARLTTWLVLAWQWLRSNLAHTRESVSHTLADGWQRVVARLGGKRMLPPAAFISLRSLDPRRRVYFFYLAMIRRGDEQGVQRKPSQTPSEYAAKLEQALPTAREDVDSMTEAFVEARYSRQEVDSNKADLVKAAWGRIRRALQSTSKTESSVKK